MAKIIKHGSYYITPVRFVCNCGCEFEGEPGEYSIYDQEFSLLATIGIHKEVNKSKIFTVNEMQCPECGASCKMMKHKYPGLVEDV